VSMPRKILSGASYLLSRRCIQRQFLLSPSDPEISNIVLFCMAHAAAEHEIEVHAATCMSNHLHAVITDTKGELPEFMHWMDLYIAVCINHHRGRSGALWEPEGYSGVDLIEGDDVLNKSIYTMANVVEAGLVRWGIEWQGLRSRPEDIGKTELVATRPKFFSSKGSIPEKATLTFVKPKQFSQLSDEDYRILLRAKYRAVEEEIQDRFDDEARDFLGVNKVRRQNPYDHPWTEELRRGLNPQIACKRKWPRIAAIKSLQAFRKEYREALEKYRASDHEVVFPAGTYWMRVHLGVECHPPP
jgi:putative transposase